MTEAPDTRKPPPSAVTSPSVSAMRTVAAWLRSFAIVPAKPMRRAAASTDVGEFSCSEARVIVPVSAPAVSLV